MPSQSLCASKGIGMSSPATSASQWRRVSPALADERLPLVDERLRRTIDHHISLPHLAWGSVARAPDRMLVPHQPRFAPSRRPARHSPSLTAGRGPRAALPNRPSRARYEADPAPCDAPSSPALGLGVLSPPGFAGGTPRPETGGGWRIERIPGRPPHSTEDGRLALPLWLVRDGRHIADIELVMSPAEAEHLHASLCRALEGHPPPGFSGGTPTAADAPYCRQPLPKNATPRW